MTVEECEQALEYIKNIPPAFFCDPEYPPDIMVSADRFNFIRSTAIELLKEKLEGYK